jgi:hypothetical protein
MCAPSHLGEPPREDDGRVTGLTLLAAALLSVPQAAAPAPTLPPTPPDVAMRMNALFAKATPAVRTWVDAEARKLRAAPRIDAALVAADARQAFPGAQPPVTPGQADVLAAMALYQVANDLDSEARLGGEKTPDALAAFRSRKRDVLDALSAVLSRTAPNQAPPAGT